MQASYTIGASPSVTISKVGEPLQSRLANVAVTGPGGHVVVVHGSACTKATTANKATATAIARLAAERGRNMLTIGFLTNE